MWVLAGGLFAASAAEPPLLKGGFSLLRSDPVPSQIGLKREGRRAFSLPALFRRLPVKRRGAFLQLPAAILDRGTRAWAVVFLPARQKPARQAAPSPRLPIWGQSRAFAAVGRTFGPPTLSPLRAFFQARPYAPNGRTLGPPFLNCAFCIQLLLLPCLSHAGRTFGPPATSAILIASLESQSLFSLLHSGLHGV